MTHELVDNRYGKSRIRLVTVNRASPHHELRDLTVDVTLEGDFEAVHTHGDNTRAVATDTMKNTVYAMAKANLSGSPESFGRAVARHFGAYPQVDKATVSIHQHGWERIATPGGPAHDAFVRAGSGMRTTTVSASRHGGETIESGVEDLIVLKTTKSAFVGFERDAYTTLPDAEDRLMATKVTATWGYDRATTSSPAFDFDAAHELATGHLLATFAEHQSASVQASIWIMAGAMLDAVPEIDWVRMILPNLHHWMVDLVPFGLENRGEVFVATTEPHGLIDATVRRGG